MEPDSVPGDLDSLQGGLSLLDPLVDRILGDSVSQQQGWLRVYGKENSPRGRRGGNTSSGVREGQVGTGTSPGSPVQTCLVRSETAAAGPHGGLTLKLVSGSVLMTGSLKIDPVCPGAAGSSFYRQQSP
ncbi:hypothetical protein ILYODFUR_037809 [Ilyodon furcidens]|uniref:Uncharacterized protein n=1 Tax=Ilyodon furcidens TaxID=33524 RepID=A0ABV0UBQ3_9TELE